MKISQVKFGIITFITMLVVFGFGLGSEIAFIPINILSTPTNIVGFEILMLIVETLGIIIGIYLCYLAFKTLRKDKNHEQALFFLIVSFAAIGITCLITDFIECLEISFLGNKLGILDILSLVFDALGALICFSAIFIKYNSKQKLRYLVTIFGIFCVMLGELFDLFAHYSSSIFITIWISLFAFSCLFAIIYCVLRVNNIKKE